MISFFIIFACNGDKETENTNEEEGVLLNAGVYQLDWNALRDQSSSEMIIENNLGYKVNIQKGYFSSYSVRLYPCSTISSTQLLLPISSAWAGHSDILVSGNWEMPVVENMLLRETILQEKSFEEHRVCDLVYTIARADGSSQNVPEDVELENLSLYIEGFWQKGDIEESFSWSSSLPTERVFPLENCLDSDEYVDGKGMKVQLTRDLSEAFDDIDFEAVDEQNGSLQILTNLVQDTEFVCQRF